MGAGNGAAGSYGFRGKLWRRAARDHNDGTDDHDHDSAPGHGAAAGRDNHDHDKYAGGNASITINSPGRRIHAAAG
jgi:hypothetical protein